MTWILCVVTQTGTYSLVSEGRVNSCSTNVWTSTQNMPDWLVRSFRGILNNDCLAGRFHIGPTLISWQNVEWYLINLSNKELTKKENEKIGPIYIRYLILKAWPNLRILELRLTVENPGRRTCNRTCWFDVKLFLPIILVYHLLTG